MFGISFGELLLISLIALLVLGPDRLPGAARTAGLWVGRLKRSMASIKEEVERELGADEIRRQVHNENIMAQQNKQLNPDATLGDNLEITPAEPAPAQDDDEPRRRPLVK
jgi:sec-independent protein translocase protein TatB